MEIIYHPDNVFGLIEGIGSGVCIIEFEDGDRHVEVHIDKEEVVKLTKQLMKMLKIKNE